MSAVGERAWSTATLAGEGLAQTRAVVLIVEELQRRVQHTTAVLRALREDIEGGRFDTVEASALIDQVLERVRAR